MTETKQRIEWQLKCLIRDASNMRENDLDWAIRIESSYKRKAYLSEREQQILDDLYLRYA